VLHKYDRLRLSGGSHSQKQGFVIGPDFMENLLVNNTAILEVICLPRRKQELTFFEIIDYCRHNNIHTPTFSYPKNIPFDYLNLTTKVVQQNPDL